ncbi:hypothetical protein HDU79_005903 [Rhizoclosmatium sp. JEL0117]|nr:hypothetical protein HDU79_005903 [Rhizoclosmatium sp. JEL0117]
MADEAPKAPTPLAALLARKKAEKERESSDTSAVNALGQPETRDKDDDSDSLENRAHVLEAEVRLIRSQLVSAEEKAARVDSLVMELVAERELKQTANEAIQLKEAEINSLKLESINLEEKNSLLAEQVTRKEKEHEEAKETVHRLQTELESLQNDLKSTSQQAHSSQSEETKYRIHTLAVEKERNELKLNVDWLNSEIEKKSAEFREFREENSVKVAELKKTVDALTFEKAALEQKTKALTEKSDSNDSRIAELVSKLADSETRYVQSQESFKTELNMQQSLANLYKAKSEEHAHRMQECLQQAHAAQEELDQLIRGRLELEQIVGELKTELEKRNEKVEELESTVEALRREGVNSLSLLAPASQLAMAYQKSGKTFTEIYAEYSELKDENLRLKSETLRLTENLNSIVSDINEKTPMIKQAITDKRNLTKEVSRLTSDLETSSKANATLQSSLASLQQKFEALESNNRVLTLESTTLGRQVQHLLVQLESAGGSTSFSTEESIFSTDSVLFTSVKDLQSQNSLLRTSLQTAQETISKLNQQNESLSSLRSVTHELQDLRGEAEKLKESLRVSELKAGSYKRERDQIKWLLDNNKRKEQEADAASGEKNGAVAESEYQQLYVRLQTEFDQFRNETGSDTKTLKDRNEELLRAKNELEISVVKVNSALNHLQERYKSLSEHSEFQTREKNDLHARIHSLLDLQTTQELRLQELTNQYLQLRTQLDSTQNELNHVRGEKDVIAASEQRLQIENAELVQQRDLATEHLKRVQGMLEDGEVRVREAGERSKEVQKALEAQVLGLKAEVLSVKEAADGSQNRFEEEVKELKGQIGRLTGQLEESEKRILELKETEQQLTKTVEQLQTQLSVSEESLARYTSREKSGEAAADVSSEQSTLLALQEDLASTNAVDSQKEHIEQYKSIAKAAEEKLSEKMAEFESTFANYREESETKIKELTASIATLDKSRLDAENKCSQALEELSDQRTQIDKDQIEFLMERSRLEDEMLRLRSSEASMQNTYQSVANELKRCKQRLAEARTDYDKVILMEGERIQSLAEVRAEVTRLNGVVTELEAKSSAAENALIAERQTSKDRLSQLEKEMDALKKNNRDLTSQNSTLHDQFENLSAKLKSLHQQGGSSLQEVDNANLTIQETERANLIRHLRREKEILERENDLAAQKVNRMQHQLDHLQKSLDDVRTTLDEVGRVPTKGLAQKVKSLETQIQQKEHDLGPLRDQNTFLQVQVDTFTARVQALEEENARLVNRAAQILGKYSRVDPAEHQSLKDQVSVLAVRFESMQSVFDAEKAELVAAGQSLEAKVAALTSELESTKSTLAATSAEAESLKSTAMEKSSDVEKELEMTKAKLKDTVTNANNRIKNMIERLKESTSKIKELTETVKVLEEKIASLEKSANGQQSVGNVPIDQLPLAPVISTVVAASSTVQPTVASSLPPSTSISTVDIVAPSPKRPREEEPVAETVGSESQEKTDISVPAIEDSASSAKRAKLEDPVPISSTLNDNNNIAVEAREAVDGDTVMNESAVVQTEEVASAEPLAEVAPIAPSSAEVLVEETGQKDEGAMPMNVDGAEDVTTSTSSALVETVPSQEVSVLVADANHEETVTVTIVSEVEEPVTPIAPSTLTTPSLPVSVSATLVTEPTADAIAQTPALPLQSSATAATATPTPTPIVPAIETPKSNVIKIQRTPISTPAITDELTSEAGNAPPSTPITGVPSASAKTSLLKQKLLQLQMQKQSGSAPSTPVKQPGTVVTSAPTSTAPSPNVTAPIPAGKSYLKL